MNKLTGIVLFALLISFGCQPKTDICDIIEISYVGMDIETFESIQCSNFYEQFHDDISTKVFSSRKEINDFVKIIHDLKSLKPELRGRTVDTRAKVLLKYESFTDSICVDRFELSYRNSFYEVSNELRAIIWGADK